MKKLIIIPVYNEEKAIGAVLSELEQYKDYDILVINDGSTDNTINILKKRKVDYINLPYNQGIGNAMKVGYTYAKDNDYDIAVQIDGDGQHDISKLNVLVGKLETGQFDLVIGSRYMKRTEYKSTLSRRLGAIYFTILLFLLTGKAIYDTTSGFRAVNKRLIHLFSVSYPYDYPEVPTLTYLLKNNYFVCELSVCMKKRQGGKSSISILDSVIYIFKVSYKCIKCSIS